MSGETRRDKAGTIDAVIRYVVHVGNAHNFIGHNAAAVRERLWAHAV